ncbi:hypothetical protein AKJ16_DCAP09335 [Drosera capensis]
MKLSPVALHETTESVSGSSTISYVLFRNGGGPYSCIPSIGLGTIFTFVEDAADDPPSELSQHRVSSIAAKRSYLIGTNNFSNNDYPILMSNEKNIQEEK